MRAPSGGFAQGWAFLALTGESDRRRFWTSVPNAVEHCPELSPAPVIIVPLARERSYTERCTQPEKTSENPDTGPEFTVPYWYIVAGTASLLMLLTAVDRGLDACFFTISPPEVPVFRATFAVPEDYDPIGAVTVG
ncbi:MAG TPA: nitroreductase family protein [Actinocrinis sp.]|nr:nitroreductase family protein [Actinocrinis sp.]